MAEVDQLVIELVADTTKFEPAIDQLEKIGQVDAKTADLIRRTNQELIERNKQLNAASQGSNKAVESTKTLAAGFEKAGKAMDNVAKNLIQGTTGNAITQFTQKVKQAFEQTGKVAQVTAKDVRETGLSFEELEKIIRTTFQNNDAIEQTGTRVVSLRTELRNLKQQLASGELSDEDFIKLSTRAAELEDRIGDVNLQIRNMASDSRNLDGTVQSIQGVAGAFQVAEGSAALFGVSLADMQEVQLRLVALLNISNGLQQIQNLLQKESAAVTLVTNAQLKIKNALTVVENGLTSSSVVVRKLATAAQWALNAAMTANPAGILVAAIAALAGVLLLFARNTETATEAQIRLNNAQLDNLKTLQELQKSFDDVSGTRARVLEGEIALMKARGDGAVEIAKKEKELADEQLARALAAKELFSDEVQGIGNLNDEYQKLLAKLDQLKKATDTDFFGNVKPADNAEEIEALESTIALVKERIAVETELRDRVIKARQDQANAQLNIQKAEEERIKKLQEEQEKAIEAERALRLSNLKEKEAIIKQELIEVEKGTEEEIRLKQSLIQVEAQIGLLSLEGQKNIEQQRLLIIAEANEKAKQLRKDAELETLKELFEEQKKFGSTDENNIQARLALVEEGSRQELALQNDLAEARADAAKLDAQQAFMFSEQKLADQEFYYSEIARIDAETYQQKEQNREAYEKRLEELDKERLAREKQMQDILVDYAFQALQKVQDNEYQKKFQAIQDDLNARLDSIEKEKNAELKNKNLTASQIEKIDEKYRKKEAEAKLASWEAQQQALESQAIMNAALAVINVLATTPYPASLGFAAGIAALAAIEVSNIQKEEPPKFKDGVEFVQGKGTKYSDSIYARLSVGERVVDADTNLAFSPALSAIHHGKVSPEFANAVLGGDGLTELFTGMKMPRMDRELVNTSNQLAAGGTTIDYDKMATKLADALFEDIDDLTDAVRSSSHSNDNILARIHGSLSGITTRINLRRS